MKKKRALPKKAPVAKRRSKTTRMTKAKPSGTVHMAPGQSYMSKFGFRVTGDPFAPR